MGMRNAYNIMTGKFEGKDNFGDMHRCEDNIKTYVKDIGCEVVDYI
jgi:hypothetical protein